MVVNCAGRWTNEAVREAGLHLPLAPTVGLPGVHAAGRQQACAAWSAPR